MSRSTDRPPDRPGGLPLPPPDRSIDRLGDRLQDRFGERTQDRGADRGPDRTGPPRLPNRTRPYRDDVYPENYGDGYADQPTGPPTQQPFPPAPPPTRQQPHTGPATGPAQSTTGAAPAADLEAPARGTAVEAGRTNASIVPATTVTGRSLTLVIAIMCFLACLTAGAVYMMNQSASAWLRDIASEVTVQIEPKERVDTDKLVADVVAFLRRQSGLATVRALTVDDSVALLEPWLGNADALKTLPVPRLIALEVNRQKPPDLAALRASLIKTFKGVSLDDHRQWQSQIRTVTRSFALGGLGILLLVAAATTAIIVSATRSAMASNRDIVEVLHFVGATDRFIAREFERHFLRLGVRAGVVGAGSAMAVFFLMPFAMELLGGGTVTAVELKRLVGSGALDIAGYVLLGIVVVVIAALCMLTSRLGVYRILHSQH